MKIANIEIIHSVDASDISDNNVDVEITMDDGSVFSATFFTIKNISQMMQRYKCTGECKNGLYFWAQDIIIVEKISEKVILESIENLLNTNELQSACTRIR